MKSFRPSPTKRAPPRASRRARQGLRDARAPPETASEPRDRSTVACYRSVLALGQCLRTGQSPQDGEIDAHRFWPRAIKSSDSSCQSSLRTLACNAMRTRSGSSLARVHPNRFDTRFTCVSTMTRNVALVRRLRRRRRTPTRASARACRRRPVTFSAHRPFEALDREIDNE